jgi:hypothetical protein
MISLLAIAAISVYGLVRPAVLPLGDDIDPIYCSAVVVEHRLLTASHCLRVAHGKVRIAGETWPASRQVRDLTLMYVEMPERGLLLRRTPLRVGEEVFVLGHALGEVEPTLRRGIIAAVHADRVWLDLELLKGMSGGAVVDHEGRLIGLVKQVRYDADDNRITEIDTLEALHQVLGLRPITSSPVANKATRTTGGGSRIKQRVRVPVGRAFR